MRLSRAGKEMSESSSPRRGTLAGVAQDPIPLLFHETQLEFKSRCECAFGEKIAHPETTARAESILAALQRASDLFVVHEPKEIPLWIGIGRG
jgi:hypothetical protein